MEAKEILASFDTQPMEISKMRPYVKNAKKHDTKQIENVANSIRRFGWQQPIVVDETGEIIIGHCRWMAAKRLGLKQVPVKVAQGLSEDEIKELRIVDNKSNESDWDYILLADDINGLDFDGFAFGDLKDLIDGVEVADPIEDKHESVGASKNSRGIKRGDVWVLGAHRLMCGSSTDKDDVRVLMDGQHAKLLFTSPPYGDLREYNGDKDLEVDHISQFVCCYAPYAQVQAVNLGIIVRNEEVLPYWDSYIKAAHDAKLKLLGWNVWDKRACGNIGQSQHMIPIRHEFIFVFGEKRTDIRFTMPKKEENIYKRGGTTTKREKDGSTTKKSSGNTEKAWKKMESVLMIPPYGYLTSVTEQNSEKGKIRQVHPATFPVALPSEYIVAFTEPTDIVIEPFCGSGTTLIASEELGRRCYAMELDTTYMNVIIDRWEDFTGEKAVKLT